VFVDVVNKIRAVSTSDAVKSRGQLVKPEKGFQDTLDSTIQQAIGKDSFFPFLSAGDSPEWIRLRHALDQLGSSKVSRSSFLSEMNGFEESMVIM